jgi:hypothetical protein
MHSPVLDNMVFCQRVSRLYMNLFCFPMAFLFVTIQVQVVLGKEQDNELKKE